MKPDLDYYTAFGFFRLASICQGVYARALKGQGQGSNSHIFRIFFKFRTHGPYAIYNESSIDPIVASNHASAMGAGAAVPLIGSEALRFARRSARINQTRSMHTSTRQVIFTTIVNPA